MNVWEYLDRNGECGNVLNALNNLRITPSQREDVVRALKNYRFRINYRAKSRFGVVKISERTMELTAAYFTSGYELHSDRAEHHRQTLLHETAHIIVRIIRPLASAHGHEWRAVMRNLGARPDRCGKGEFLAEMRQGSDLGHKHEYTCQSCGHVYRTKRALKRLDRRFHGPCGSVKGRLTHKQVR